MSDQPPPAAVAAHDLDDEVAVTAPPPKSAEDRKAAAALANLADNDDDDDDEQAKTTGESDALKKALTSRPAPSGVKKTSAAAAPARAVKVDQADVALLVSELELSKAKATELLKAHEGSAVKALRAYVAAPTS